MDKIILSSTDVEFVLQWRDEHKDLVRRGMCPLKAVKLAFPDVSITVTAIREHDTLSFGINRNGKSVGKLVYNRIQANGLCVLDRDTTKLSEEDKQAVLTVYFSVMALPVFGKSTITRDESDVRELQPKASRRSSAPKKKSKPGIIYILGKSIQSEAHAPTGSRKKIDHEFSVRGHYRHYKNGKTIWIREYTKGRDKKQRRDKTYKIGEGR